METAAIIDIRRMTEAQYQQERETIRATYGESSAEAAAKRDQAMAKLFNRSGWTQEELAKVENKTRQWVAYRLRFGTFLSFATTVANSEIDLSKLTEGKFRHFWSRTSGTNERQRFVAVQRLMENAKPTAPRRHGVGQKIVEHFGDGKWHHLETIAKHVEQPPESLRELLSHLDQQNNRVALCEKKAGGKSFSYRIVRAGGRKIDLDALLQELEPILEIMEYQGAQHRAALSPSTVLTCTHNIRKLLEKLDQATAPNR